MPQVRFIDLDVHKKKIAVAPAALAKLLQKLGKESATLHLC
jgi:hypothetical protein